MNKIEFDERVSMVKNHIYQNRKVYIAAAAGVVVGVTVTIVVVVLLKKPVSISPTITQKAIGIWKPEINQFATQIVINAPGNSGNVIQDLATGIIYPSQNAAAKALNLDPSMLSRHLNGENPNVSGRIFKKIIDGATSHELHTV